jgi:hypothetical protein
MSFLNISIKGFRHTQGTAVVISLDSILVVACEDIITLNANLSGLGGESHTYLWTQISGTPVIWLEDQNQVTVMFEQPAVKDDKVFQFTVDAGTTLERSAQIIVTGVPRDTFPALTSNGLFSGNQYGPAQLINQQFVPGFTPIGHTSVNNPNRAISWINSAAYLKLNGNGNYVTEFDLYLLTGDSQVLVKTINNSTIPNTQIMFITAPASGTYRLDQLINKLNQATQNVPGNPISLYPPNQDGDISDSLPVGISSGNVLVQPAYITRQLVEQTQTDDEQFIIGIGSGHPRIQAAYITRIRTVQTQDDDEQFIVGIGSGNLHFSKVVTDTSIGSLG